jgi:hypothetical protein
VWQSNEPHAWATSHYGRWAYSNNYNRWYWAPDTQWGPSWVEWRQTGSHFGWAPLAPDVVVRAGWRPPVETWHYCPSERILDVNVGRYYEPRDRVVVIHREARPFEHYSTVSGVRVVVGPGRGALREHRVVVRPVRVEARTIGRWNAGEAHAQAERAREHREVFETNNQHRIEGNARLHTAQVKVIETHPQIKVQVNARVQAGGHAEGRVEEHREPEHREPNHVEPARPEPNRGHEPERRPEPNRGEPNRGEPPHQVRQPEPARPEPHNPPAQPHPQPAPPQHAQPAQPPQQHGGEQHQNGGEQHPQPAPQQHGGEQHPNGGEQHPQPAPQQHGGEQHPNGGEQHPNGGEHRQPEHKEPEHKDEHH